MSPVALPEAPAASLSDVGLVRSVNEDCCGEFTDEQGRRLLVVADGMGGHRGGATASRTAVEIIGKAFAGDAPDPEALLLRAVTLANQRIFDLSQSNPELRGMGTTVVLALLAPDGRGWVAHVGDSRAYRLRGRRLERLTEDHSVVAEMVRKGVLSEAEAACHPRRNEILRSVGVAPDVEVDVAALDVQAGDRLLLCSDGLCGVLQDDEIAAFLSRAEPAEAARMLVAEANTRGGPDNITVQIVAIPDEAPGRDDRSEIAAARAAGQAQAAPRSGPCPLPPLLTGWPQGAWLAVAAVVLAGSVLWWICGRG